MPASVTFPLPHPGSLLNGLALSNHGESAPPLQVGPLSLLKMMIVLLHELLVIDIDERDTLLVKLHDTLIKQLTEAGIFPNEVVR